MRRTYFGGRALESTEGWLATALALLLCACARKAPATTPVPPPGGYGSSGAYGTSPPGTPYYGAPPYTQPAPGQQVAGPPPVPAPAAGAPAPSPGFDWITNVDAGALRSSAQGILNELVAALPPAPQSRVVGIPMLFDPTPGEVNAFAACVEGGKSIMATTDGLLDVTAHLAQAAATDELFGTQKVDEYIQLVARNQRPGQPLARPAPGFFAPQHVGDPRRIARQHALFEEQIAFVLGHELAHHYLGHLPCTAGGPIAVTASQLGNALSSSLPLLNQPAELAADVAGMNNLLSAGRRRPTIQWGEGGALLTMRFFMGIEHFAPEDVLFAFERSHPPAVVRQPVILQTAATWRATGGAQLLFPF